MLGGEEESNSSSRVNAVNNIEVKEVVDCKSVNFNRNA